MDDKVRRLRVVKSLFDDSGERRHVREVVTIVGMIWLEWCCCVFEGGLGVLMLGQASYLELGRDRTRFKGITIHLH
ncbi:hypothetical protein HBI56_029660 [Parastagonospora nodorum]|nr:hypothetical protein HBH49_018010 [Parastagonospora nodorum]KAH4074884.1 hypothetical protein HBH50_031040 [Parastagonospora nodorum]KAH4096944.1 hypothetical protein HBH48_039920 [Parastagonospora nodorum]KAH4120792.1 hypothetical protein HBH47_108140 [Parastagonospora nodorum]KAH4265157.1 hypothetical protein HBI03_080040 [Parastagonospora nodorum]